MEKTVYITTQTGKIFEGKSFGADTEVTGELVFTTGMVGYNKTITDAAYYGQIVVQTFPLIGNYGFISEESESDEPHLKAYIVNEVCELPSNFRSEGSLIDYFKKNGIVGVYGVDTRELAKHIRQSGTVNAKISFEKQGSVEIKLLQEYKVTGAVENTSVKETEYFGNQLNKKVVVWDFGGLNSIINHLVKRDLYVVKVPYFFTAKDILSLKPCGVLLSSGGGNPNDYKKIADEINLLKGKAAIMGIGLGHQLLGMSYGAAVEKMKSGHRGGTQPTKDIKTGKVYMTEQNHGYCVNSASLKGANGSFINVNDGTNEGIVCEADKAFSVQFAPSNATEFLYDDFAKTVKGEN